MLQSKIIGIYIYDSVEPDQCSMPFKRDLALQINIHPSQNSPPKCNPKLKMKMSLEVLNIICTSSIVHTEKNWIINVNCQLTMVSSMTNDKWLKLDTLEALTRVSLNVFGVESMDRNGISKSWKTATTTNNQQPTSVGHCHYKKWS